MKVNRREALAALAAAPLAAQSATPKVDQALVDRHDAAVRRALAAQITDPNHRGYGSLPAEDGLYEPGGGSGLMDTFMAACLNPQSKFHHDTELVAHMKLAAGFLNRSQHANGTVDLLTTNFDSTPDVGFVVHGAATAACLAQRAGERELFALLEPFLRKAGAAMAVGGVHTPNHRWVVSAALAQIHELLPDSRYVRHIDQWLAEGIDIDAEGQYTERSTSVYNPICDRAFVVLAAKLKRPELFDPVRRNLESMLYLMHADLEVVTEISRRQDKGERGDMGRYWFPLQYLAAHDKNPVYAGLASKMAPQFASLSALMEYPELTAALPGPAPPPADFEKAFPGLGIVRVRRGPRSATVVSNDSVFFTLRHGGAVITAVRMAGAFFGKGQFLSPRIDKTGAEYTLRQTMQSGYYQPFDPPRKIAAGEWGSNREQRRQTEVCHYEQSAAIQEVPNGFRLRLAAKGTAGVPVAIEIGIRPGVEIEGATPVKGRTDAWLLPSGHATVRGESGRIRIGPGLGQHAYVQVRGAEPKLPGNSLYLTAFAPFEHTIEFLCDSPA